MCNFPGQTYCLITAALSHSPALPSLPPPGSSTAHMSRPEPQACWYSSTTQLIDLPTSTVNAGLTLIPYSSTILLSACSRRSRPETSLLASKRSTALTRPPFCRVPAPSNHVRAGLVQALVSRQSSLLVHQPAERLHQRRSLRYIAESRRKVLRSLAGPVLSPALTRPPSCSAPAPACAGCAAPPSLA